MKNLKKLLYYFTIFIFLLFFFCGTFENGILFTILSFFFIYFFVNHVSIKKFSIFLIGFCLITKIAVVFFLKTPLTGDFVLMYDTAKHIVTEGVFTLKHSYFNCWGYQLFHVFYEAIILSIVDSISFLKILNCVYSTVSTILIYMIVKKLTNEKTARISSLLYAISFYPLYLNTILGNQQLGLMIAYIGIYLFLYHKPSLLLMALVGILFGISHLERNEGMIYLLTALIYLFFQSNHFHDFLKRGLVIAFCFFFITQGSSFLVKSLHINEIGFGNANPEWKFLLGFNFNTNGKYDINDEVYLGNLEEEKKEIINRVTNFKEIPGLFYNKIRIQFLYEDFGASFDEINFNTSTSQFKNTIFNYTKVINFTIILLALFGIFKKQNRKKETFFFITNLILFFLAYLFIEICARYYYYPQLTIIILASLGLERIEILFKKLKTIFPINS